MPHRKKKKNKPADTPREQISFANFPQLQAHEKLKNEIETVRARVSRSEM
jgi:hypothetical protein